MAGYLITLNDETSLMTCIQHGVYSTILNPPPYGVWGINHEGTFADYLSMKEGDLVFFFIKRKIYGCGMLVNVAGGCKYINYIGADSPAKGETARFEKGHLLEDSDPRNRCFCLFKPYPAFFASGVDMDEVLQNKSCPFHSLRTLWKVSFIKLDDDESLALFNIVLKHNEKVLSISDASYQFDGTLHKQLASTNGLREYSLTRKIVLDTCINPDGTLKHEMALEAAMCELLTGSGIDPFGKWDYVSHQVAASPFKPIDYMDKMDIFGYRYIEGYRVKSRYLIAELKKGLASSDVIEQIMKYVDWVADEYANGDYSMIEAYVVAADFSDDIIDMTKQICVRNFNKGFRPTTFSIWKNVKLVRYDASNGDLSFSIALDAQEN